MVRGMDERFDDPSEEDSGELEDSDETVEETSEAERDDSEVESADQEQSEQQSSATTGDLPENKPETDEDPLNIREDWDSATIYVEPEQSEDIEVAFTRLKKQLKRENVTLEKNKHFYRGIFEVAFNDHREETKEKIRELAKKDTNE